MSNVFMFDDPNSKNYFWKQFLGGIFVVLTRDAAYRKKPEMSGLARLVYRKYPAFVRMLEERHAANNAQVERIAELERQGSIFVIRPEAPLDIARLEKDPQKVQRVYNTGFADAQEQLSALRTWLNNDTGAE